jgi:hypothetical protein
MGNIAVLWNLQIAFGMMAVSNEQPKLDVNFLSEKRPHILYGNWFYTQWFRVPLNLYEHGVLAHVPYACAPIAFYIDNCEHSDGWNFDVILRKYDSPEYKLVEINHRSRSLLLRVSSDRLKYLNGSTCRKFFQKLIVYFTVQRSLHG